MDRIEAPRVLGWGACTAGLGVPEGSARIAVPRVPGPACVARNERLAGAPTAAHIVDQDADAAQAVPQGIVVALLERHVHVPNQHGDLCSEAHAEVEHVVHEAREPVGRGRRGPSARVRPAAGRGGVGAE